MRLEIRYSKAGHAAYVYVGGDHRLSHRTVQVGNDDDVMADLDEDGQVIGIELLGVDEPVVHVIDDDVRDVQRVRPRNDLL